MPISKSEQETQKFASEIAQKLQNGGLLCLFGEIGSGKTTFTKYLAENFGIEKFQVKSPTYTYIRSYENTPPLYHIDLYRLEDLDEHLLHEITEICENPHNIVIIEWAERLEKYLPQTKNRLNIYFKYLDDTTREIELR